MAQISNVSGLPHVWFEKADPSGASHDVLAVRGSFELGGVGEPLTRSEVQSDIVYGDEFDGPIAAEPLRAVVRREGNLVIYKPGTDIHVTGTARAPDGKPARQWLATVRVGATNKTLRLHGPRSFRRAGADWRLGPSEPTSAVALDYRLAFGGLFVAAHGGAGPAEYVQKSDNPAGRGWLPDSEALGAASPETRRELEPVLRGLDTLTAPQIEHPDRPVVHPTQRVPAEGFAPVARWCEPRLRHAGTRDAAWLRDRFPRLPEDFVPRFYQSAHPDLIVASHLAGDEPLALSGLLPEGPYTARLPGVVVFARAIHASGKRRAGPLRLDTVSVDLDERGVALVWRAAFDRVDPVVELAVGAMTDPGRRVDV
jgi:hypothetical protein